MAAERIYTVTQGDKPRLVRATHPNTALMHVARDTFEVRVATQNDLEALLPQGVKVESLKSEQLVLTDADAAADRAGTRRPHHPTVDSADAMGRTTSGAIGQP